MSKCDSCRKEVAWTWISYSDSVQRKRNWEKEFLAAKKGIIKNNDFQLCSPCQKEIKEFEVNEVVKELGQNNLVDAEYFPPGYLKINKFHHLREENILKIWRAVTQNIQRHIKEWKIIRAKLLNSDREYYHDWSGDIRNKELEILIHQSAKLEYGEDQFLKREENKMFLQEYFPSEQWAEIKEALEEKQNKRELAKTSRALSPKLVLMIVVSGAIILLILCLLLRKKKVKKL